VIFRGVFNTGGYGINITQVEVADHVLMIHATYTDPGEGMIVTQAFTQPTAILPIGMLEKGSYEVKLMVTSILRSEEGDRTLEEGSEHGRIAFTVN
jgi:galactose-1-phosphate uridylyltransferase